MQRVGKNIRDAERGRKRYSDAEGLKKYKRLIGMQNVELRGVKGCRKEEKERERGRGREMNQLRLPLALIIS